jgi:hypothetical protein
MFHFSNNYDPSFYERQLQAVYVPTADTTTTAASSSSTTSSSSSSSTTSTRTGVDFSATKVLPLTGEWRDGSLGPTHVRRVPGIYKSTTTKTSTRLSTAAEFDSGVQGSIDGTSFPAPQRHMYHIPGYAGFVKGKDYLHGDTFGKSSRRALQTGDVC